MIPVPFFIPTGGSHGPANPEQIKMLIGIFSILNITWIITIIVIVVLWYVKDRHTFYDLKERIYDNTFSSVFSVFMIGIWAIILLINAGTFFANHFIK